VVQPRARGNPHTPANPVPEACATLMNLWIRRRAGTAVIGEKHPAGSMAALGPMRTSVVCPPYKDQPIGALQLH
jgi:hypothetical protein